MEGFQMVLVSQDDRNGNTYTEIADQPGYIEDSSALHTVQAPGEVTSHLNPLPRSVKREGSYLQHQW